MKSFIQRVMCWHDMRIIDTFDYIADSWGANINKTAILMICEKCGEIKSISVKGCFLKSEILKKSRGQNLCLSCGKKLGEETKGD